MVFETLGIGMILPAVTIIISDNLYQEYPIINEYFGFIEQEKFAIYFMLFFLLLFFIKALYVSYLNWRIFGFSFGLQRNLSKSLFSRYLSAPYAFHLQNSSSNLLKNVTSEISIFSGTVQSILMMLSEILIMLGLITLLFFIEPYITLIVIFVLTSFILIFQFSTKKIALKWGKQRQYHEGQRIKHIQQGFGGIKEIKLYRMQNIFSEYFDKNNRIMMNTQLYTTMIQSLPRLWLEFIGIIAVTILILSLIISNHNITTLLPIVGAFLAAAFRSLPSINRVLNSWQSLRFSKPAIDVVHDQFINLADYDIDQMQDRKIEKLSFNKIKIKNLVFSYSENMKNVFEDLNVEFSKNSMIGIVGPSGEGKSTFINLLTGLLKPNTGKIKIDSHLLEDVVLDWQANIGYVPQSVYLLDDTLRNNIIFGYNKSNNTEKDLEKAISNSQLDSFIESLPKGLDTLVGENGARLSGGQRQRIAIARVLYRNTDIIVLDEATNSLDEETEKIFMELINNLRFNKTIIIITHKLSNLKYCTDVYSLANKKLIRN